MRSPAEILPHGASFRFVDEILSFDGGRITAARRVPLDEPWTGAHFPGEPLVPGVILLEGMVQTCGLLARLAAGDGAAQARGRLAGIKSAKFLHAVRPGERLVYEARRSVRVGDLHAFAASASVGERCVAQADVLLAIEAT
jgi:3-hydroxyacyl-[acyl-carrier-protein] dehydratase